jgi:hypothetical protein
MAGAKIMKLYKDAQNNIFAYELDGSQDHLVASDMVQITKEQADEINRVKAQQNFDSLSYSGKRVRAYPSIQEQLDLLYWDKVNGTNNWEAAIEAVKTEYPKP